MTRERIAPPSVAIMLGQGRPQSVLAPGDGVIGWGEQLRWECDGWEDLAERWREFSADHQGPVLRAFVALTFDEHNSRHSCVLSLPECAVWAEDGQWWRTVRGDGHTGPAPEAPPVVECCGERSEGRQAYVRAVEKALTAIGDGALEKVVLATHTDVHFSAPVPAAAVARQLWGQQPGCWVYCVDGLVGASPEILVHRQGHRCTSRVLAGTVPAGISTQELAAAFAPGSKNDREHSWAVESALARWEPVCEECAALPRRVLSLRHVSHLASDIEATGPKDVWAASRALHPTAAVSGVPNAEALQFIASTETADRGRYAGAVGWVDTVGDGRLLLALRGGQVSDDGLSIRLFAGAGIVDGSDPAEEWQEVSRKLAPMRDAVAGLCGQSPDARA